MEIESEVNYLRGKVRQSKDSQAAMNNQDLRLKIALVKGQRE